MLRLAAYIRVSTEEQATSGYSLSMQKEKIEQFCNLYEYKLLTTISDEGISAKSINRPGITKLISMMDKGQIDGVIIYKLDRLTRSLTDWQYLIDNYFGDGKGYQLLSVTDKIDTTTATGRLCLNVLMSVSQWEREIIGERTKSALIHKKSKGEKIGHPKFGTVIEGKFTAIDDTELKTIHTIKQMRLDGFKLQQIADYLNENSIPTKRGKTWYPRTVKNVLDDN